MGSGCEAIGNADCSDTRGSLFESGHLH